MTLFCWECAVISAESIFPSTAINSDDLRRQIESFSQIGVQAAVKCGLKPEQYRLLQAFVALPINAKPTIRAICGHLGMRPRSSFKLFEGAERSGLIVRRKDEIKRRETLVELTGQAQKLCAEIEALLCAESLAVFQAALGRFSRNTA